MYKLIKNNILKTFVVLAFVGLVGFIPKSNVYAYGTLTSGTFDTPPDESELAEGYVVYKDGEKYTVDEKGGFSGLGGVVCGKGSVLPNNTYTSYLILNEAGKKHTSFTSEDPNVATIDENNIYCNNIGYIKVTLDNNIVVPASDHFALDYIIRVYDVQIENEQYRQQIIKTIDQAMLAWASGRVDIPMGMNEDTVDKLSYAFLTGQPVPAALGVELSSETNLPESDVNLIKASISDADKVAGYYDISLSIADGGTIEELVDDIRVAIKLPNNLPDADAGFKRTFYIVRIHNGAATKLSAFVDGDNIEFDSDSFSSYALVYNDTFSDPNTGEMYVNNKSVKQCLFIFPSLIIVTIGFWIKYIRRKQTK